MKTKSPSYLKAEAQRDRFNAGRERILAKDLSSVAYFYTSKTNNHPCAVVYSGRALKPISNFAYRDEQQRAELVAKRMANIAANTTRRQPAVRALEVDDVLRASWGYDQTNVDYYKVVGLKGATMVQLIVIGATGVESGDMRGTCIPDPDATEGEIFDRRVDGERVRIDSVRSASKEQYTVENGKRVYNPTYYSSYA